MRLDEQGRPKPNPVGEDVYWNIMMRLPMIDADGREITDPEVKALRLRQRNGFVTTDPWPYGLKGKPE